MNALDLSYHRQRRFYALSFKSLLNNFYQNLSYDDNKNIFNGQINSMQCDL